MSTAANPRQFVIKFIFIGVAAVILIRLLFLQLFEDKYKVMANDIAIYRKVVYPPRGVIYDRKGKPMVYNQVVYDLVVTPNNVPKNFDTAEFCDVLGIDKDTYIKTFSRVRIRNGGMRQSTFMEELSPEQTARYQENMYSFIGYDLVRRYIRTYPNASAGIVLGYLGEVSPDMLKKERYSSYQEGDYTGMNGLERSYEEVLRGQRGIYYMERDNFNRPRDPYRNGALDTEAVAGRSLQLYLDADLEAYAEKLMQNKIGSVVAIDPKTGGILAMVSSPSYDPNLLRGRDRGKNYAMLYKEATAPLLNRAMQATYQPGSTIKPMTGLVALDVGAITPSYGFPCLGGYNLCGRRIACEHHDPGHAANFRLALAHSCNSYFCHVFRLTVDDKKFGGVKKGLEVWHDYFYNFGYGHPTGVDIPFEGKGLLPDSNFYNERYDGVWNSCTIVYVGMGQGELALTPLQMANGMCIIANKGYYYTPHFVRAIDKNSNDSVLRPYLKKHKVASISDSTFSVIQQAMQDVVESGTAEGAKIDGINMCAKTGTVENKAIIDGKLVKMPNHSMFVAFAPRENPRIAVAVAVENAGFGARWAAPIASLMIEKYLRDSISIARKPLEQRILDGHLINKYVYIIDSERRMKDKEAYEMRVEQKKFTDSTTRARDSVMMMRWLHENVKSMNNKIVAGKRK
ncbi:MAG TPA: penicillin-binding protein 2 [Flavipsychrobacter sp.]|nr:penicillin-binding protein 2 [Flavipsychrobacter sp.]